MTDGKIFIGLHSSNSVPDADLVHPDAALHAHAIEKHGIDLAWKRVGDEVFNEFGFLDPSGQAVRIRKPPRISPATESDEPSFCGDFAEYSIPAAEFQPLRSSGATRLRRSRRKRDSGLRMSMTSDHLTRRASAADAGRTHAGVRSPDMSERIDQPAPGCDFADPLLRGSTRATVGCCSPRRHGVAGGTRN
jgi:hypothetical protein